MYISCLGLVMCTSYNGRQHRFLLSITGVREVSEEQIGIIRTTYPLAVITLG